MDGETDVACKTDNMESIKKKFGICKILQTHYDHSLQSWTWTLCLFHEIVFGENICNCHLEMAIIKMDNSERDFETQELKWVDKHSLSDK